MGCLILFNHEVADEWDVNILPFIVQTFIQLFELYHAQGKTAWGNTTHEGVFFSALLLLGSEMIESGKTAIPHNTEKKWIFGALIPLPRSVQVSIHRRNQYFPFNNSNKPPWAWGHNQYVNNTQIYIWTLGCSGELDACFGVWKLDRWISKQFLLKERSTLEKWLNFFSLLWSNLRGIVHSHLLQDFERAFFLPALLRSESTVAGR